jgi:hypothetical protein
MLSSDERLCLLRNRPDPLGPTQLSIQLAPWALSRGVKRLGFEAGHAPPSRAMVRNEYSCLYF